MNTWVKMLETVTIGDDVYSKSEKYELDETTAKAWADLGKAEVVTDPSEELFGKFNRALDEKIEKLTDAITATPKVFATPKDDSDKTLGDFALRVKNYYENRDTASKEALCEKYYTGDAKTKTLNLTNDGAIVPTPLAEELLRARGYEESVYGQVRRIAMTADTLKYPVVDQAGISPSGGQSSFGGGVVGAYDAEDDDANDTEPDFTSVTLNATRYTMSTQTTPELLADNVVGLEQFLRDEFSRQYSNHMSHFIINGSGSSQPTGIVDHAGTVVINRGTASNVAYADLATMASRIVGFGRSVWVIHQTVLPELLNLEDTAGNLVWQPNARDSIGRTLLGMPVIITEISPSLGNAGDVCLCNFADGYLFGERQDLTLSFSDHVQFIKGRRVWKAVARNDGKPVHASTITLADGSTTVGEFVQLDDATS